MAHLTSVIVFLLLLVISTGHIIQASVKIKDVKAVPANNRQVKRIVRNSQESITNKKKTVIGSSNGLSHMKIRMESRVKNAQSKVNQSRKLSNKEKEFKLHVLEMFLEELKESEKDMLEAEQALKKSLSMDFWNTSVLKINSKNRLDALRIATLKEERSLNRMNEFETNMKKYMVETNSSSWMGELLKEISHAADQLEESVAENVISEQDINLNGGHIEAVLHVKEKNEDHLYPEFEDENPLDGEEDGLDILIDSKNNKYILTRQKDATSPIIDHVLVLEIILLLLLSVPLGFMCQLIGVPSLFGYILAGVLLGPSGLNIVQEIIQIETIGELGVFMIMFCAGLEFSFERVAKVWKVALQVPIMTTLIMVLAGVVIGSVFLQDIPVGESAFVSACLSLSSTPLVTRFVQGSGKESIGSGEYGSLLMGVLVIQDVMLSIIISLLPGLASHKHSGKATDVFWHAVTSFLRVVTSLGTIAIATVFVIRYVTPHYARLLSQQTRELQLLGTLFVMYLSQIATSFIGISMELGCFVAGAMLAQSSHLAFIEQKVTAVHDLLSVLFFATIGFHVFPAFVFLELTLLLSLTAFVVAGKYGISLLVLRFVLPAPNRKLKYIVSSGLAQVSEFSFVLGSRAHHLKIISREVFLLILSVSTLSLLMAPILWKLSLWRYRVRHAPLHIR